MMKETQDVVICVAKLAVATDKTVHDAMAGSANIIAEIANFVPVLIAVPAAISNCQQIPAEIANASAQDKADLVARAKTELGAMPDAAVVALIDQALDIVLSFWQLVDQVHQTGLVPKP